MSKTTLAIAIHSPKGQLYRDGALKLEFVKSSLIFIMNKAILAGKSILLRASSVIVPQSLCLQNPT